MLESACPRSGVKRPVVEASGVSRSAIYRRWPSLTDLLASALDEGRTTGDLDLSGDIKSAIVDAYFSPLFSVRAGSYSERQFRKRIALVMENPDLQRAYWLSHVRRRRAAIAEALSTAVDRGELRDDIDVESCIDLLHGVFYYQAVARGASLADQDTVRRCRNAFDVV